MPSTSGVSAPLQERSTVSGNQPRMQRLNEKAAQTFLAGVPVEIDTTVGAIIEWDGTTVAAAIAGVSKDFGANLAVTATAQQQSFGTVPNQSSAKNFSRPFFNDGLTGLIVADQDTVFYGQVGTTTAVTDVGKSYGLTKDTDNHWYVDKGKTGANAVVKIVGLDPNDTSRGVLFVFLAAASQIPA